MKLSSVVGFAAVAVGAWWVYRRFSAPAQAPAEATPTAVSLPTQPTRGLKPLPAPRQPKVQPPVPHPPDSDPRFQKALARWQATQSPGYVGISYGRPFWRWTGSAWTVTQGV